MEAVLTAIVGYVGLGLNAAAIFVITYSGAQAFYATLRVVFTRGALSAKRLVWTDFASWLVLALEFELAADLLRTIMAPTWADLGQLGAIAAIRTFLNYFLEKDIESAAQLRAETKAKG